MKRGLQIVSFVLAILLALAPNAAAVTAAPTLAQDGWSSIDIWAYVDNDRNGYISQGDSYLHEIGLSLTDKKAKVTYFGATDYGDMWWEPMHGGVFITWLDAVDPDLGPGLKLNSITCKLNGVASKGACTVRFDKWEAQFNQSPGDFMNVYYGFVPVP